MLQGNVRTLTTLISQILDENISLLNQTGTKIEQRTFGLWGLVESVIQDLVPMNETVSCEISNLIPYDVNVYGD